MNVRHLKAPGNFKHVPVFCLIGALAGVFCLHQPCLAQESSQPSVTFADPLKQINWISGPQKVTIGAIADVNIPNGYRFADGRGARIILESVNNPVPDDVIGVLAPNSGKWWAILEYTPKGYVKDAETAQINSTAVLKAVQKQLQTDDTGSSIKSLNWQSQPVYDPQTHSLEWSLQVQTPSAKALNETVVLLGRHGVMQITAVRSYPLADSPSLKQMISNIAFKQGERYSDYQNGDKVAEIGLAELIAGKKLANTAGGFNGATAAWVYSGLALLLLGGLIVLRKKNRRHRVRTRAQVPVAATVAAPVASLPSPALKNGELHGASHPTAAPAARTGLKHTHRSRKKRVFDYPKFYTNVMKELSFHSYAASPLALNGKSNGNGHSNGHTNGHTNGHSNGHANGTNGSGINETIKSGIEELIATQKSLIQEQKCLLEQQTKLIAEKRWLIEEQTAFLKGQAGMISDQQFPLKFE